MIYYGNIAQNWHNANASGDHKMKRDILLSEIAKIIVGNPELVNKHLVASGFKPGSTNPSALSDVVSAALKKSPKFANKMAHEIIAGHYSATGATTATIQPVTKQVGASTSVSGPIAISSPVSAPISSTTSGATSTGTVSGSGTSAISSPTASTAMMAAPSVSGATTTGTAPAASMVYVLGQTFGGLPTSSVIMPAPVSGGKTTSGDTSGGGGGGGDLGGGGGGGSDPSSDLKDKVNAVSGKAGISANMKKALLIVALIGVVGGAWYYFK